jgi:hypothetical protein
MRDACRRSSRPRPPAAAAPDLDVNKKLIDRGDRRWNTLPALRRRLPPPRQGSPPPSGGGEVVHQVRHRWIVNNVPVEAGQAVQPGAQIAEVVGRTRCWRWGGQRAPARSSRHRADRRDAFHRRRRPQRHRFVLRQPVGRQGNAPIRSRPACPTPTRRSPTASPAR